MEELPEETLLVGRKIRVVRTRRWAADGKLVEREVVRHPGAVTIIPMVDADRVCLVRNVRIAVGETLIELPAGTLDEGEDPIDCARRELAEETGYRAGRLEKLCEFFMSPGVLDERMRLVLATELTPGEQELDEGEDLEPLIVPWREAMRMVDAGEIRDSKTLAGLLFYDRIGRRK
jgi:ADP-ribose pyrophosphatase